jgi:hypothetical protein
MHDFRDGVAEHYIRKAYDSLDLCSAEIDLNLAMRSKSMYPETDERLSSLQAHIDNNVEYTLDTPDFMSRSWIRELIATLSQKLLMVGLKPKPEKEIPYKESKFSGAPHFVKKGPRDGPIFTAALQTRRKQHDYAKAKGFDPDSYNKYTVLSRGQSHDVDTPKWRLVWGTAFPLLIYYSCPFGHRYMSAG